MYLKKNKFSPYKPNKTTKPFCPINKLCTSVKKKSRINNNKKCRYTDKKEQRHKHPTTSAPHLPRIKQKNCPHIRKYSNTQQFDNHTIGTCQIENRSEREAIECIILHKKVQHHDRHHKPYQHSKPKSIKLLFHTDYKNQEPYTLSYQIVMAQQ